MNRNTFNVNIIASIKIIKILKFNFYTLVYKQCNGTGTLGVCSLFFLIFTGHFIFTFKYDTCTPLYLSIYLSIYLSTTYNLIKFQNLFAVTFNALVVHDGLVKYSFHDCFLPPPIGKIELIIVH